MTENEAKIIIEGFLGDDEVINEALEMAVKALEEIKQYRAIGTVEELKSMKENGAFEEIIDELAEEYNNGWIPVSERLPEKEGSYLVVGKTGGATVTKWYPPSQFYPNGHFGGNSANYIRYWMPRPKAPIQEEEG